MALRMHQCKVTGASVDWLTVTASTKSNRERLWNLGERLLNRAQSEGEHTPRWHAHGYSGRSAPHLAIGARDDSVCLRLSSYQSGEKWIEALAACENVTRLDLAVDCELDSPATSLARQVYNDAGHITPVTGRPPKRRLIVSGDGGSTVYIGARVSQQMGRLYDKGVESKTRPAGCWWRWEVEYKGDKSAAVAATLGRIDHAGTFIVATVASWFRARSGNSFTTSTTPDFYKVCKPAPSVDAQLSWLARGVRPTVRRLLDQVGVERVLFALGIPPQSAVSDPSSHSTHE